MAVVVLAMLLASCQTTPDVPAEVENGAESARPLPPAHTEAPAPPERPATAAAPRPSLPVDSAPAAPLDLIGRISEGLVLPAASHASIDRELDWYVSNADYLNLVLRRSERYLHHIVEALQQAGMPLDLALLPIVESAYDPFAYSRGRAAGLWQIIPGTGRELGLKQDWWYDARRDVLESTEGALQYLRQLQEQFDGDWLLAVAGYNAGGGSVSRALRRAAADGETTDFWGVRSYLPVETRTYVPRLMALARLVADPAQYGVSLPTIDDEPYFRVIETGGQIDMAIAAQVVGMSTDELYLLNPGVNHWATDPDGPHRLLVPVGAADGSGLLAAALTGGTEVPAGGERRQAYLVQSGDSLWSVARRYGVTVANLALWNSMSPQDILSIGRELVVWSDSPVFVPAANQRIRRVTYTVRRGDSLYRISTQFRVSVADLLQWNNISPERYLQPGQQLILFVDVTNQSS